MAKTIKKFRLNEYADNDYSSRGFDVRNRDRAVRNSRKNKELRLKFELGE
jgi:hypothetical protein